MANPSLKRKLGGGAEYKIPNFQKPDYFHILGSLLQTVLRQSVSSFQGKFLRIWFLQTYANMIFMGSPVLAINRKQYAWIRGLISTPMQSFFFPGNKAICRDLEIMHFLGGRRYHSGSPENILSDWLVFYSPLSRPRVCC